MTIIKQFAKWLDSAVDGIAGVVQSLCRGVIIVLCFAAFGAICSLLF